MVERRNCLINAFVAGFLIPLHNDHSKSKSNYQQKKKKNFYQLTNSNYTFDKSVSGPYKVLDNPWRDPSSSYMSSPPILKPRISLTLTHNVLKIPPSQSYSLRRGNPPPRDFFQQVHHPPSTNRCEPTTKTSCHSQPASIERSGRL